MTIKMAGGRKRSNRDAQARKAAEAQRLSELQVDPIESIRLTEG
jgi:hypothetical protein